MVKQKMISVKLDVDQLHLLDDLCLKIGCNRNKMINFAVFMVNKHMQDFRFSLLMSVYADSLKVLLK